MQEFLKTNEGFKSLPITVVFDAGPAHNHPLMAIWIEDTGGRYLETLYVAKSIGVVFPMEIIGYSHYSGTNGLLYEDINSLTTAKNIAGNIRVRIGNN